MPVAVPGLFFGNFRGPGLSWVNPGTGCWNSCMRA